MVFVSFCRFYYFDAVAVVQNYSADIIQIVDFMTVILVGWAPPEGKQEVEYISSHS